MEQLTKNQAVATSQEAVQNQNEPQLRDENAHNDKSVHGVLNPTYQAGLRRDAVQPDIEAEQIGRAVQQECPRPISYAVFCLKKKKIKVKQIYLSVNTSAYEPIRCSQPARTHEQSSVR